MLASVNNESETPMVESVSNESKTSMVESVSNESRTSMMESVSNESWTSMVETVSNESGTFMLESVRNESQPLQMKLKQHKWNQTFRVKETHTLLDCSRVSSHRSLSNSLSAAKTNRPWNIQISMNLNIIRSIICVLINNKYVLMLLTIRRNLKDFVLCLIGSLPQFRKLTWTSRSRLSI